MRPFMRKGLFFVVLTVTFTGSGWASPLSGRLLALVPPGSQIVAGFENRPGPHYHGRLLLTTHNNRVDLDDWQALTGVDTKRVFEEIVEVAAAQSGSALTEHMILVAGRLDRERIFHSLTENGAKVFEHQGVQMVLVKPLARERGDMLDDRWLAILDNRTGIFGTPWLVQQALRRSADHAVPDSILEERLSLLRRDVTSWNVLVSTPTTTKNMMFAQPRGAWAQLQQDADVLMVAARFGPRIRIDFSIHADSSRGPEFFTQKAGFFTNALGTGSSPDSASPDTGGRRLADFSLEGNRVHGSVEMSSQQFEVWCDHIYLARAGLITTASTGN
jgi:hypothetical protein